MLIDDGAATDVIILINLIIVVLTVVIGVIVIVVVFVPHVAASPFEAAKKFPTLCRPQPPTADGERCG